MRSSGGSFQSSENSALSADMRFFPASNFTIVLSNRKIHRTNMTLFLGTVALDGVKIAPNSKVTHCADAQAN